MNRVFRVTVTPLRVGIRAALACTEFRKKMPEPASHETACEQLRQRTVRCRIHQQKLCQAARLVRWTLRVRVLVVMLWTAPLLSTRISAGAVRSTILSSAAESGANSSAM